MPIGTLSGGRARAFLDEFRDLSRTAANEEELRTAFAAAAVSKLGIRDLRYERGRQDVRRNRVIIEFKARGRFRGGEQSAAFQEALQQLTYTYIPAQAAADQLLPSNYIGICFDGDHLAFVFLESDTQSRVSALRPLDERSANALIEALDNDARVELTPDNVARDFGPDSQLASQLVRALWLDLQRAIERRVSRVEMLLAEWGDLFEQSTSLGRIGQARLDEYFGRLGLVPGSDAHLILFALHTYHALFFKLLAAEVVLANSGVPDLPQYYCFEAATLPDPELSVSLQANIEDSHLFRRVNIRNFIEGSFFTWYLVDPSTELLNAIRHVMVRLTLYRLNGLQLSRTRDIVKRIYQQLVPAPLRHSIGEYFTPEWLTEYVLDRAGYTGSEILHRTLLDPTCGSGTFLIHAIDRYKGEAWKQGWTSAQILDGLTKHVVGFDLNPLAVLTARVNYLIAIAHMIGSSDDVEIPVFQADAVYAPVLTGSDEDDRRSARRTDLDVPALSYQVQTRRRAISITLPASLIEQSRVFGRALELLEATIQNGDSADIFAAAPSTEAAFTRHPDREQWRRALLEVFAQVDRLERGKPPWDRIWSRIIRNYFASASIGPCSYVVGNPPWVRWSELPPSYCARIQPVCLRYGIFSEDRFFGGNELDVSGLITYTVADKWLADEGRLSFVLTATHLQSQSSGGFRQLSVRGQPLGVETVDDFVAVRPFHGVSNKPAVVTLTKGQQTSYPVPYHAWSRKQPRLIAEDADWEQAREQLARAELEAQPLSTSGHRWCILPPSRFDRLRPLDGEDKHIEGRKGIVTDLNGGYFVEVVGPGRVPGTVRVRNVPSEGRTAGVPSITHDLETALLYPLIKGAANISAFHATTSSLFAVVPNEGISAEALPTVTEFGTSYPLGLRYFRALNIRGALDRRSTWRTRMRPVLERRIKKGELATNEVPFFAIYDVGPYTFSSYKVVWAEMAGTLEAAVVGKVDVPHGGGLKPIVPDHKVYFAPFSSPEQAHFVCALLNSEPVRTFVDGFTRLVKLQVGTLFRHLQLPEYRSEKAVCEELAQLSKDAHARRMSAESIDDVQKQINTLAAALILNE